MRSVLGGKGSFVDVLKKKGFGGQKEKDSVLVTILADFSQCPNPILSQKGCPASKMPLLVDLMGIPNLKS